MSRISAGEKALLYLKRKAAKAGDADAQIFMAECAANGRFGKESQHQVITWLRDSEALAVSGRANRLLGRALLLIGEETAGEGLYFLERAVEMGELGAIEDYLGVGDRFGLRRGQEFAAIGLNASEEGTRVEKACRQWMADSYPAIH